MPGRVHLLIVVTGVASCAPPPSAAVHPRECTVAVPPGGYHPAYSPDLLVGDFNLILVYTEPAGRRFRHGRLHLERNDSTQKFTLGRQPDHVGWFDPVGTEAEWRADSAWRRIVGSRNPLAPGVLVRGAAMRIGAHGSDGPGDNFTITAVSDSGFWGWWREDYGIEIAVDSSTGRALPFPGGFFCARRLGKAAA